jgi:hypothetical protein
MLPSSFLIIALVDTRYVHGMSCMSKVYHVVYEIFSNKKCSGYGTFLYFELYCGAPERTRTFDLELRSLLLYPAELPGHTVPYPSTL